MFEIPTGYWGDGHGPKRVLIRVVLWRSGFTAATSAAWNWLPLVVTRFLFGAGEAGCFPNLTKAFESWLPPRERIRAQGVMWMSARWGGAVTPFLVFLVLTSATSTASFRPLCLATSWAAPATGTLLFYVTAGVYGFGSLCWWLIDPVTPLDVTEQK